MLENISVIGFDLDGTLYPITPKIKDIQRGRIYECISEYFEISAESARERFEKYYQKLGSGIKGIELISEELGKPAPEKSFVQEALESADFLHLFEKNPALNDMLARISKTSRLDLLTGSTYDFLLRKLERLGISPELFASLLCHENGSKLSGKIYLEWLSQTRISPQQHLYVGDNPKIDVDVPKTLGIKTCIVGSYYENADFQIGNILGLERLLF